MRVVRDLLRIGRTAGVIAVEMIVLRQFRLAAQLGPPRGPAIPDEGSWPTPPRSAICSLSTIEAARREGCFGLKGTMSEAMEATGVYWSEACKHGADRDADSFIRMEARLAVPRRPTRSPREGRGVVRRALLCCGCRRPGPRVAHVTRSSKMCHTGSLANAAHVKNVPAARPTSMTPLGWRTC